MALPVIEAVVTADTDQAERGFRRVGDSAERMGDRAQAAGAKAGTLGNQMGRVGRSSGAMRAAIQNASFQLGDFAVMVGGGVDASRALATQLPQLLGPFGVLGAVMSAVVAIGIPLASVFSQNADNADTLRIALGTVYPMVEAIGDAMKVVGQIAVQFAEVVINNLDRIIITAGVAATLFGGKFAAGFIAARIAAFSFAGALAAVRGMLIRTGIGALIVAAGELVYQFTRLVSAAGGFGAALGHLGDLATETFRGIGKSASGLYEIMKGISKGIAYVFVSAFATIAESWNNLMAKIGPVYDALASLPGIGIGVRITDLALGASANDLREKASQLGTEAMSDIALGGDLISQSFDGVKTKVEEIRDLFRNMKDEKLTLPDLLGTGDGEDGEDGKASKKLDEELTAQEERIKAHFDRIKALTTGGLSDKLGAWGDYFDGLVALTGSRNEKLLRIAKTAKAAQALVDAWAAYNQTLADPSLPWFAKFAAAGQVLAAGIGAVNAIKGVSSSGATGGGGGSSSGASVAASAQAQAPLDVTLRGTGQMVTWDSIETLLDDLNDRAGDRGYTIFMQK